MDTAPGYRPCIPPLHTATDSGNPYFQMVIIRYSIEKKQQVIESVKAGSSIPEAAREHKVSVTAARKWLRQEQVLPKKVNVEWFCAKKCSSFLSLST